MTIELFLKAIQESRAYVAQWGVNAEALIAIAAMAFIAFIFSLREVLSWYLRVHSLREEVRGLRSDIAEVKSMLRERPSASTPTSTPVGGDEVDFIEADSDTVSAEPDKKKAQEKPGKTFPLSH